MFISYSAKAIMAFVNWLEIALKRATLNLDLEVDYTILTS